MNAPAPATKAVIVVDRDLNPGLAANTAAVLSLTLGHRLEGIIGPDLKDASGQVHAGITTTPIPILVADQETLRGIRAKAAVAQEAGLSLVDFSDCAQRTTTYEDYGRLLESSTTEEIAYLGLALYGPKKQVQKLTGSLGLLR